MLCNHFRQNDVAVCTREACAAYIQNYMLEELNRKYYPQMWYTACLPGITIVSNAWLYTKGDSAQYPTYLIPRTVDYL